MVLLKVSVPRPDPFKVLRGEGKTCWDEHATDDMVKVFDNLGSYAQHQIAQGFVTDTRV